MPNQKPTQPLKSKTVYLYGETETVKDGIAREKKILRVQKKLGPKATQSAAVRLMIDVYQE